MEEKIYCSKTDVINLIYYADTAALILKQNGYPGKAKALEDRYMKVANAINLKSAVNEFPPR